MEIRILSFNIHKGVGWITHKSTLDQIHIYLREQNPDIVFLQEVRGSQFETMATEIWPHFSYGKNAVYQKGHHGNAILSKFPIHFSKNIDLSVNRLERRGLLHSIVTLPNQSEILHLLCVHLGLFKKDREKQLKKIITYMEDNIPANEPLILGGDFNDWSNYATGPLIKTFGLREAFLSSQGKYARTYPAWAPIFELDRIYLRGFAIDRAHRLTKKKWRFLSDHIAIEVYLEPKFQDQKHRD